MCWSAEADLVAGAGIAAVGVACVVRARTAPRVLPLAALPLLLGAHQMIEAAVWAGDGGTGPATVLWAVIALPLLPLWVPLGVLLAVPGRRTLMVPAAVGVLTAAALVYALATRPVSAEIRGHTVGYVLDLPAAGLIVAGYLFATIGSLLLSGDRGLRVLGVLVTVGALVCVLLWRTEFVSTWCAFAAVCSVVLLGWVRGVPAKAA
ncbi:DUF6629 family protein [Streptomyces sp. NPDC003832]